MSAAEADLRGKSSRVPGVKAEVFYEHDSKHRAANMSASCERIKYRCFKPLHDELTTPEYRAP